MIRLRGVRGHLPDRSEQGEGGYRQRRLRRHRQQGLRPAAARGPGTGFHDDRRRGEKSRCCAGSGGEDRIEALHMRGAGDCRRNRSGTLRSGADGGVGFCERLAAERLAAEEERFSVPRVHNPGTNWSYCEKRKGDHGYDTVGLQCDSVQLQ